jgi:ATP-dependent DNA helicase RecQ
MSRRAAAPSPSRPARSANARRARPARDPLTAARRIARERFGVDALRDAQEAVIARVLAGRHTLAVMPTGAGKSLTYQVPALLLPGVTLVISPLIALMQDQAGKLDDAGVSNAALNSTLSRGDEREALQAIDEARHEIVFATPERLADPAFIARMKTQTIDRLVVDEAHCISHWGHDFRPAFLEIGRARRELGTPPVLALTATATEAVIEDIREQLGLDHLDVINSGVHRPNLQLAVRQVTSEAERSEAIVDAVRATPGAGIVYCATVRACNELADQLARVGERDGFAVTRYHGRLPARERRAQQDAFMAGQARIMVATSAFGMGIDKADLRFVVHYQMPGTLEAYAQEAGRAGRDGLPAHCTLLYWRKDRNVQQFFIAGRYPNHDELARVYGALPPHDAAAATIDALSADTQVARNKLQVALKLLRDAGLAAQTRTRTWRLTRQGAAADRLAMLATAYRERAEHDRRGLEKMVGYAHSGACRWKLIAEHFGDDSFAAADARCQHCDNCERLSAPIVVEPPTQTAAIAPAPRAAFAAGDAVTVPRYGDGVVREASAEQVTVAFGDELRTFVNEAVQRRAEVEQRA